MFSERAALNERNQRERDAEGIVSEDVASAAWRRLMRLEEIEAAARRRYGLVATMAAERGAAITGESVSWSRKCSVIVARYRVTPA